MCVFEFFSDEGGAGEQMKVGKGSGALSRLASILITVAECGKND